MSYLPLMPLALEEKLWPSRELFMPLLDFRDSTLMRPASLGRLHSSSDVLHPVPEEPAQGRKRALPYVGLSLLSARTCLVLLIG